MAASGRPFFAGVRSSGPLLSCRNRTGVKTMRPEFEREWRMARTHEKSGDLEAAREIYQALIAADPHRLYVRLRLSALEQAFGDYRASCVHALEAAETVERGRRADLAPVARRLLDFGECERVRRLVSAADWDSPEVLRDSAALTQYLWLAGDPGQALRLADRAHARVSSPLLSYARANALRYCGRMEEATREYERCLQLKPDYALAHWSLAYHAAPDRAGARVDRIGRALASLGADDPDRAYLHYALFKELDHAGEIDAAWKHLSAGARCKHRSIRYRAAVEREGFEAVRRLFAGGQASCRSSTGATGHVPIFIVGLPRTGTTLLERIIGAHAGVRSGGELNDFPHALAWEANRFPGTGISAPLVEALAGLDFARVGERYLQRTAAAAVGSAFLVDKNPMNFMHAGFIARALPSARILCLRRSPMDACFSNYKELFTNDAYGYSYDLVELADHFREFERLCALWQETMPERFMTVDYEALVSDPLATAERVMAFCGIPFDAASVDITRNASPVSTASSSQVRQPINARGIGAWRRYAAYLRPLEERLNATAGQRSANAIAGAAT